MLDRFCVTSLQQARLTRVFVTRSTGALPSTVSLPFWLSCWPLAGNLEPVQVFSARLGLVPILTFLVNELHVGFLLPDLLWVCFKTRIYHYVHKKMEINNVLAKDTILLDSFERFEKVYNWSLRPVAGSSSRLQAETARGEEKELAPLFVVFFSLVLLVLGRLGLSCWPLVS